MKYRISSYLISLNMCRLELKMVFQNQKNQKNFVRIVFWEREGRKSYQAYRKDRRHKGPDKVIVEGNPTTTERNNGEVKCPSHTNKHVYFIPHRNTGTVGTR